MSDVATLIEGVVTGTGPAAWAAWVPSFSCTGSMTFGTVTVNCARYLQIGKIVFFNLYCYGTTGGSAHTTIKVSMPVEVGAWGNECFARIDSAGQTAGFGYVTTDDVLCVCKMDSSNWTLGASRYVIANGFYEAA